MASYQRLHYYDRKDSGCQYKNPFLFGIIKQKRPFYWASFILNFVWKILKIKKENPAVSVVDVRYSRKITEKERDANRDGKKN